MSVIVIYISSDKFLFMRDFVMSNTVLSYDCFPIFLVNILVCFPHWCNSLVCADSHQNRLRSPLCMWQPRQIWREPLAAISPTARGSGQALCQCYQHCRKMFIQKLVKSWERSWNDEVTVQERSSVKLQCSSDHAVSGLEKWEWWSDCMPFATEWHNFRTPRCFWIPWLKSEKNP